MVSGLRRAVQRAHTAQTRRAARSLLLLAAGVGWAAALALWAGADPLLWLLRQLGFVAGVTATAAALWVAPGWALLRWLWPERLRLLTRLALALGAGLALPPLLLLLFHLLGLPWNRWTTLAYAGLALAAALPWRGIGGNWAGWVRRQAERAAANARSWPGWLLAGLTATALVGRLYLVRDLPAGLWGDSYQHTVMAQLLVDNAGLFSSWLPYAPLTTFTYHFGFHANAALWHWLTGESVMRSVVVSGQALSAATVPAAYLLAAWLTRRQTAGVWAALLTAFINLQPAYYFNWGRYTQLTGQVLIVAVLIAWLWALERPRLHWRPALLAALLTAGLLLTHYIVSLFAALFLAVYAVARLVARPAWREAAQFAVRGAAIGAAALVLAAPWIAITLSGYLVRNTTGFVNGGVEAGRIAAYASLQPIPPLMLKDYILWLAAAGCLAALARRRWRAALPAGWAGLMLLAVAPHMVGLPGAGIIDNFAVYIALYLPAIPLAAFALAEGQHQAQRRAPRLAAAGAGAAIVLGAVWGFGWQVRHLYAAEHQLYTPADAQAVEWIKANTAHDARFFVNTFPAFGGTLIAGNDGGWWLPLAAGRDTNLPPLTYGSERGPTDTYSREVSGLAATLRGRPLTDATPVQIDLSTTENYARLLAEGYAYVYLGAHAQPGPEAADTIDAAALRARPDLFELVYDQAGVQIFALTGRAGTP